MDKISIIVPIYNVELYLKTCLDSIINQTYKNLEIILVDDGSTDKSGMICDHYAKLDNRIKVIHKKNEGVSSARNEGLNFISGSLVAFVDPDDYIEVNAIERAYLGMKEYNADIVCFDFCNIDGKKIIKNNTIKEKILYADINGFGKAYYSKYNMKMSILWNKLYKKDLFKDIRFPYKKKHEDTWCIMSIYMRCKKILVIPDVLYYYRINRKNSIMYNAKLKKDIINFEVIEANLIFAIDYKALCPDIRESNEWAFHIYKSALDQILFSKNRKQYWIYENILIKYLRNMIKENLSIKSKVGILKRTINVNWYYKIKKLLKKE